MRVALFNMNEKWKTYGNREIIVNMKMLKQ